MRVAILSDKLIVSGGAERYLVNMMRQLLADGDTVDLFTTKVVFDERFLAQEDLRVHRQNLSWCPRKLRHIFFKPHLKSELRRRHYDMVWGLATPYAPEVAVCFGTFLGSMLAAARHRLCNPLNWVRVAYEAGKYRHARYVVVHSHAQKIEMKRLFGVADEKIRVLSPPIVGFETAPVSSGSDDKERLRHHLTEGCKHFVFVSNNHYRKGLKTIIRAFDALDEPARKDCRVLVVGTGQGRFPDRPYLKWLGYVNDMETLYRVCDAALLPSRYEPFGKVVAEALLSGLPVFVSDQVGAVDVLEEGMGWVTPVDDARALTQAVQAFLAQPFRLPEDRVARLRKRLSVGEHIAALKRLHAPAGSPRDSIR